MRKGDWKKKKDKRDLHKKYSMQYDAWDASYPHYEHEAWHKRYKKPYVTKEEKIGGYTFKVLDDSPRRIYWEYTQPSYKDKPKVKRNVQTIDDYRWYGSCPKAWNKLYHIRPVRRKWKQWVKAASRLIDVETYCDMHNWYDRRQGYHWSIWDDMDEEWVYCECEFFEMDHISEGMPYPSDKKHVYYY